MGHIRMMAAVQPFLSGAISKTVNMPSSATVEDVERIYLEGWRLGLKALAIYRDNCKVGQPLSDLRGAKRSAGAAAGTGTAAAVAVGGLPEEYQPVRRRLPKIRPSRTVSFSVGGAEGYMTAGSYPDDGLGEVFIKMSKQGSTLSGVMDAFSIAISIALQYGVPLDAYVRKFINMRFEPAGMTDDPDVRMAQSVMDYLFRRLALDYLPQETRAELGVLSAQERARQLTGQYGGPGAVDVSDALVEPASASVSSVASTPEPVDTVGAELSADRLTGAGPMTEARQAGHEHAFPVARSTVQVRGSLPAEVPVGESLSAQNAVDAPLCFTCGVTMRPAGSCYVCEQCGSTSGCS